MTLEELLSKSGQELSILSDSELLEYLKPYITIEPESVPVEKTVAIDSKEKVAKKTKKKRDSIMFEILKDEGLL